MAHFRATIRGQRGEASRLGNGSSGMRALVQTWDYDLRVSVDWNGVDDLATVELVPHDGSGTPLCVATANLTEGTWRSGHYRYQRARAKSA